MSNLQKLPAEAEEGRYHAVIETPRGSRNKYAYEPQGKYFKYDKVLPAGSAFPFDFGFIPSTEAEDGDPIDILVLSDEPLAQGCVAEVRLIGALRALQTEEGGEEVENDRLVGIVNKSIMYTQKEIDELPDPLLDQIEEFFKSYNKMEGRKFKPTGRASAKEAAKLIKKTLVQV